MTLNYKPESQSPSKLAYMCIGRGETDKWICLPFWQAPYTEKEKKTIYVSFHNW